MTARLLARKIDSLRNCLARIEGRVPFTVSQIKTNYDLQDIVAVNLERATQVCVDIAAHILSEMGGPSPETMGESFALLARNRIIPASLAASLKKAVGMRNMLVHEYAKIDWALVHGVCHRQLGTYRRFAAAVVRKSR